MPPWPGSGSKNPGIPGLQAAGKGRKTCHRMACFRWHGWHGTCHPSYSGDGSPGLSLARMAPRAIATRFDAGHWDTGSCRMAKRVPPMPPYFGGWVACLTPLAAGVPPSGFQAPDRACTKGFKASSTGPEAAPERLGSWMARHPAFTASRLPPQRPVIEQPDGPVCPLRVPPASAKQVRARGAESGSATA